MSSKGDQVFPPPSSGSNNRKAAGIRRPFPLLLGLLYLRAFESMRQSKPLWSFVPVAVAVTVPVPVPATVAVTVPVPATRPLPTATIHPTMHPALPEPTAATGKHGKAPLLVVVERLVQRVRRIRDPLQPGRGSRHGLGPLA